MSARFLEWWRGRTQREQRLLAIMFGLAALVLAWLLVVRPLSDALDSARTRHGAAVLALAEARAREDSARLSAGRAPAEATLPIDAAIGRSAAEAGFAGARITGEGPRMASVAIDAARPQALFAWVARLEQSGLAVARLSASANGDRTVSAEIAFRAGGS